MSEDALPPTCLVYDETIAPDQTINPYHPTLYAEEDTDATRVEGAALRTLEVKRLPRLSLSGAHSRVDPGAQVDLEILGVLGEGGMGIVHLARQASLQREVAIKRVKPREDDGLRGSRSHIEALLAEAMFTGSLEHPGIIPVHALGRDREDQPLMVMQKVEGTDWRALIQSAEHPAWSMFEGDRTVRHIEILMRVCDAVHYAHSRGVVHRDIKPENVMIGAFGEVYLMDWGIALRMDRRDEKEDTALCGTPAYLAPEMLLGAGAIDARTDVYLLGASLHEALTGEPRHRAMTLRGVLVQAGMSVPYDYPPSVPAGLAALCNQACHREPDARHQSALELRKALEAYLARRGSLELGHIAATSFARMKTALDQARSDPREVHQAFDETRFACRQALREWSGNEAASTTLRQALEVMIEHELEARNAGAAEALIDELGGDHPTLRRRLEALLRELAADATQRARLAELEFERDERVSLDERLKMIKILTGILVVGGGVLVATHFMGGMTMALIEKSVFGTLGIALALCLGAWWKRDIFLRNEVNRRIVGALVLVPLSISFNRALGVLNSETLSEVLARDCMVLALVAAAAGVQLRRFFLVPALVFAGAAFVAMIWPGYAPLALVSAVSGSTVLVLSNTFRRVRQLEAAFEPTAGSRSLE